MQDFSGLGSGFKGYGFGVQGCKVVLRTLSPKP